MNQFTFQQTADKLTTAAIHDHLFPGGVVGFSFEGHRTVLPFGHFTYEAGAPAVTEQTIYDVASVTKSIPTSTLVMQEIEAGRVQLDTPIVKYLPELTSIYRDRITVRHLLTYTIVFDKPEGLSGLVKLYGADFLDQALASELTDPPGLRYVYTNQPALMLGLVLERATGQPLGKLAQDRLFGPLDMARTSYFPEDLPSDDITPSELVDDEAVRGIVHDESARMLYKMGRQAGQAGVFSAAGDLLRFGDMMTAGGSVGGHTYLQPETIESLAHNQLAAIGEYTGLGWEIHRPDVMGEAAREQVLIKSGHTGCLVVIDLAHHASLVLLSNRMYPHRGDREGLRAYWRAMNEVFLQLLS